jgi:hypothetical protein
MIGYSALRDPVSRADPSLNAALGDEKFAPNIPPPPMLKQINLLKKKKKLHHN